MRTKAPGEIVHYVEIQCGIMSTMRTIMRTIGFSPLARFATGSYTVEFRYASYTYYTPESFGLYFGTKPAN